MGAREVLRRGGGLRRAARRALGSRPVVAGRASHLGCGPQAGLALSVSVPHDGGRVGLTAGKRAACNVYPQGELTSRGLVVSYGES